MISERNCLHALQRVEEASSSEHGQDHFEARRLLRKIDIRLLPICAAIYAFALIDRVHIYPHRFPLHATLADFDSKVNLPNARIAGADKDLGLSIGNRYTIVCDLDPSSTTSQWKCR